MNDNGHICDNGLRKEIEILEKASNIFVSNIP